MLVLELINGLGVSTRILAQPRSPSARHEHTSNSSTKEIIC